jgi:uncharacterized protein DUF5919
MTQTERTPESGAVVSLNGHPGFRPNFEALARQQVISARRARKESLKEFAALLTSVLGWRVTPEAVESWERHANPPGDVVTACEFLNQQANNGLSARGGDPFDEMVGSRYADVTAIYGTRSEFQNKMPSAEYLDNATTIRACGLSLNLIVQSYSESRLLQRIRSGTSVTCLFLKPFGTFIAEREAEEEYENDFLSNLTSLNITIMRDRVAKRLGAEAASRLVLGVYDRPLRFNLMFVDDELCIAQPYLPAVRGVDSPTFVIRRRRSSGGLYQTFEAVFNELTRVSSYE